MRTPTRQQRRKTRRKENKKIVAESQRYATRRKMDESGKQTLDNYRIGSKYPAILLHGMRFDETSTLQDYIYFCHETAESFDNTDTPQWILLVRSEADTPLPAEKRKLMKIGTRIFRKSAPKRPFLFLELTQAEVKANKAERQIAEFIFRCADLPEETGDLPGWLSDYIYREPS